MRLGDIRAVEPLLATLQRQRLDVRRAAVEALGRLGDVRAVEPLLAMLRDSDVVCAAGGRRGAGVGWVTYGPWSRCWRRCATATWYVRRAAVEALVRLGDVRAVEPLLAMLRDSDGDVRLAAVEALGRLGDVRAVEPLLAMLQRQRRGCAPGGHRGAGSAG